MLINAQDDHKKGNKRARAGRSNPRSNKNKVRKIKVGSTSYVGGPM